jgi:crossover junction endodeoxyribonuclease RuvC
MTAPRTILGVDPGTEKMGYGIVQVTGRDKLRFIAAGVLYDSPKKPKRLRLQTIAADLVEIIAEADENAEPPTGAEIAAEDGVAKYATAALAVGEARGIVIGLAGAVGRDVALYPPTTIKKVVTSLGNASKNLVAQAVARRLGLKQPPEPDAADALAVAICHAILKLPPSEKLP